MATTDNDHPAGRKPLHVGDTAAVMWRIEKDALLRQTMTAVLILDRSPDRQVLLNRLDRASRALPPLPHKLVEVPLRLSTPRWLVDPNGGLRPQGVRRDQADAAAVPDVDVLAGCIREGFDAVIALADES